MNQNVVGEIVVRIPLVRGETGRWDFVEAGEVDIVSLTVKDDDLEYARYEANEGDLWHNCDLHAKVRDRINAEPVTDRKAEMIIERPSLADVFERAEKYVTADPASGSAEE
ncbi:hypothetical protein [Leifsonia sp. Leaf264]|uniref:hypothetical protein n=1 Tax=Leifsonia sp. Leaf264 TaxID=1736314 RepID=UPI0007014D3E|nr:hypothetical protein [Leifsonia sp. Leaf264]KQO96841.1 hypothetical protein ASF30_17325 [Leifsonia sp. Leaf264]